MGFRISTLFGLLNGDVRLHVNCAFRIVPKPCSQLIIFMAYDPRTFTHVDVMHVW